MCVDEARDEQLVAKVDNRVVRVRGELSCSFCLGSCDEENGSVRVYAYCSMLYDFKLSE